MLRPYIKEFYAKLTARDKRRIAKNKVIAKFQTVKKTIGKGGKVQVWLVFGLDHLDRAVCFWKHYTKLMHACMSPTANEFKT